MDGDNAAPQSTVPTAPADLERSIQQLVGYLYKHKGGPGFGAGRLKGAEMERFEALVREVKEALAVESGVEGEGSNGVREVVGVDAQEQAVLKAAAKGLERAAQGNKAGLQELLQTLSQARGVLEGWVRAAAAPVVAQEEKVQIQVAPAPALTVAPSQVGQGVVVAAEVDVEREAPEAELSKEERTKLQGVMALALKHSGAFGKMSGPLQGTSLGVSLLHASTALPHLTLYALSSVCFLTSSMPGAGADEVGSGGGHGDPPG